MPQHSLLELARLVDAQIVGAAPDSASTARMRGVAALRDARADEVSFCGDARFLGELARSAAGAVVISRRLDARAPLGATLLCEDAGRAFSKICALYASRPVLPDVGVHPSAIVDRSASLGRDVRIGPGCVVGPDVRLDDGAILHAGVIVAARCEIGPASELFPRVVLYEDVRIGARCRVHAGAILGADGFGYQPPAPEDATGPWAKIPQTGRVVVEDDVEIGANATIDRARFGATRIGRGAKLDNLVHVAHNVVIGPRTMIAAQVGIAGSARLGGDCQLGGQSGIAGHIEVGSGTKVAGMSGVWASTDAGADLMGYPARPRRDMLKQYARAARLERLEQRLAQLERALEVQQAPASSSASPRGARA